MKKKILILMIGFFFIGVNLYADMTIDINGNVGIGTDSPTSELEVVGNVEADGFTINSIPVGTSSDSYWSASGGDIYYNSGYVGIWTTSPSTPLDVSGVITAAGGNSNNWNTAYGWGDHASAGYLTSYTETDPFFTASPANGITSSDIANWNEAYGWGNHALVGYDTTNDSWTGTGDVYMTSGNVGIGTTSPSDKLHVVTTDESTNALFAESNFLNSGVIDVRATNVSYAANMIYGKASRTDSTAFSLFRLDNGTEPKFVVRGDGNVGIGTTSPVGKLDVNGAIYQRGAVLHADYVFEDDYKLESIKEHAYFMWKNKHLKAIPKAQVDENGMEIVEIGSHRKGIVEELEKAHIYIAQLEKKVSKIAALEAKLIKLEALLNELQ